MRPAASRSTRPAPAGATCRFAWSAWRPARTFRSGGPDTRPSSSTCSAATCRCRGQTMQPGGSPVVPRSSTGRHRRSTCRRADPRRRVRSVGRRGDPPSSRSPRRRVVPRSQPRSSRSRSSQMGSDSRPADRAMRLARSGISCRPSFPPTGCWSWRSSRRPATGRAGRRTSTTWTRCRRGRPRGDLPLPVPPAGGLGDPAALPAAGAWPAAARCAVGRTRRRGRARHRRLPPVRRDDGRRRVLPQRPGRRSSHDGLLVRPGSRLGAWTRWINPVPPKYPARRGVPVRRPVLVRPAAPALSPISGTVDRPARGSTRLRLEPPPVLHRGPPLLTPTPLVRRGRHPVARLGRLAGGTHGGRARHRRS